MSRRRAHRSPDATRRSWRLGALLWVLAGAMTGCTDIASIDRAVDRLVQARSGSIGAAGTAPETRPLSPEEQDPGSRGRQVSGAPATTNPPANELRYAPGDTDPAAVLKRLESYAGELNDASPLDLAAALKAAQATGREYRSAEEDYLLAAIRQLSEEHLWGPRFFDDIRTTVSGTGDDATYASALNVINELRATQRLPYGGDLEAKLVTQAAQQLTSVAGEQYTQSSQIVLNANLPLLRGAGDVAREDLIQARRDLVYAARAFETFRRQHLVDIARDYFALVAQQNFIVNQEQRLASVIALQERTTALVEAGRAPPFRARNVEQNVLTSRNSLIQARESYLLALDQFKVRLGMDVSRPIKIEPVTLELPDPDITVARAAELALSYRLDYQNQRDQTDDARRHLSNARNSLLPDLNLNAGTTLNTDKARRRGRLDFDLKDTDYTAGATLSLPLDRQIDRLNVRAAMIQLQRQQRESDRLRDTIILDARHAVREIDRARNALVLLQKAVEINQLRSEELDLRGGEVDPQDKLDAENELLQARNSYEDSLRDLRISILEYLLQTGQLRVSPGGTLTALSGMVIRMVGSGEPTPSNPAHAPENPPRAPEKPPEQPPVPAQNQGLPQPQ